MTDYERDYLKWKNDQSKAGDFIPAPDRNNYDANGYKKGSVVYEEDKILDPYLIQTYGIEYARENPRRILKPNQIPSTTMTLDEAIQHCEEKSCGNNECAMEHKQLKAWLEELKELREFKSQILKIVEQKKNE